MNNFEFYNPTKIIFGKNVERGLPFEINRYGKKVLLHYGGSSIKSFGLYERVIKSLQDNHIEFVELGGVQPNPRLDLVYEGIRLGREQRVDLILAVGGGSVIDSAKAIAVGIPYDGDVWDFYTGQALPETTLPVGVVLTHAAAGSEASPSSVISKNEGKLKRPLDYNLIRPVFSFLNPELTYSVSSYQTACGVSDIMSHIMERYFTQVKNVEVTDRLCEASLKTIIHNAPIVLDQPDNYAARSEIMWGGTIAHNDMLGTGREGDWACHMIEHELSAFNDVAHGEGLAIIFPAWMKYVYKQGLERFVQFAVRVWNIEQDFENPEKTALDGINKLISFYKTMGLATTLSEIGIAEKDFSEIAAKCRLFNENTVGHFVKLTRDDIIKILDLAK